MPRRRQSSIKTNSHLNRGLRRADCAVLRKPRRLSRPAHRIAACSPDACTSLLQMCLDIDRIIVTESVVTESHLTPLRRMPDACLAVSIRSPIVEDRKTNTNSWLIKREIRGSA